MREFEHFSTVSGAVCPVCKTAADAPTYLIPMPGTEDDGIVEAKQMHVECFNLVMRMSEKVDPDQ